MRLRPLKISLDKFQGLRMVGYLEGTYAKKSMKLKKIGQIFPMLQIYLVFLHNRKQL